MFLRFVSLPVTSDASCVGHVGGAASVANQFPLGVGN